mgnify:CR=1 FL=1|jgi:hypothetical protein
MHDVFWQNYELDWPLGVIFENLRELIIFLVSYLLRKIFHEIIRGVELVYFGII